MKTRTSLAISSFVLTLAAAGCAQTPGKAPEQVGKVEFKNSCSPAVQEKLLGGIAMLHSFYYSAAQKTFEEVAAEDNSCVIAAWGFASILMSNPLAGQGASAKDGPRAQGAIDKGRKMGAKTERERDYLEAVAAYYDDFAGRPERARQLSRAKAYEALAAKYPDDDEAQIFSALYLAGTQLQSDQTYAPTSRPGRSSRSSSRSIPTIRASRTTSSTATTRRRSRSRACRPRAVTRRSRPMCRMRCTCLRTSLPASANGPSPRRPTAAPRRWRRRTTSPTRPCTRSTT